jgi:hypothetical protein
MKRNMLPYVQVQNNLNKPRDRGTEYAFILGSMDIPVVNNLVVQKAIK